MVLYGNNFNGKITPLTVAFTAALIANFSRGLDEGAIILTPILLLGLAVSFTLAHLSPVSPFELYAVLNGVPGSIFELANTCMRGGKDL